MSLLHLVKKWYWYLKMSTIILIISSELKCRYSLNTKSCEVFIGVFVFRGPACINCCLGRIGKYRQFPSNLVSIFFLSYTWSFYYIRFCFYSIKCYWKRFLVFFLKKKLYFSINGNWAIRLFFFFFLFAEYYTVLQKK